MVDRTSRLAAFEIAARAHAATLGTASRPLYEHDLDEWLAWCVDKGGDATAPELAIAAAFGKALEGKYAAATARRKLAELSAMYEEARDREEPIVTWNPFKKKVKRPPQDDDAVTEAISLADTRRIIEAAREKGGCDATVLEVLHATGLRISEVLGLKRDQVVVRDGRTSLANVKLKKRGRVAIEVTAEAAAAIAAWLEIAPTSSYLFPRPGDVGKPFSRKTLYARVAALGTSIGLRVHPHRFRAAFATDAAAAGTPLHVIQAAMHHADPKTTRRYISGVQGNGVADTVAKFRKVIK